MAVPSDRPDLRSGHRLPRQPICRLGALAWKWFALGSGPGRALALKEPLFQDLGYADKANRATLVIESDKPPPARGGR